MEVKIVGKIATITTKVNKKDLEKTFPTGVTFYDDDKKPVYMAVVTKAASFSANGISFDRANTGGNALVQLDVPEGMTGAEFAEQYADAIVALEAYEEKIVKAITERSAVLTKVAKAVVVE